MKLNTADFKCEVAYLRCKRYSLFSFPDTLDDCVEIKNRKEEGKKRLQELFSYNLRGIIKPEKNASIAEALVNDSNSIAVEFIRTTRHIVGSLTLMINQFYTILYARYRCLACHAAFSIHTDYLPPWRNALPPLRVPMIYRPSFSCAGKGRLQNESWRFRGIRARD